MVEGAPDGRVAGDAAGAVGAAADGADDELGGGHRHGAARRRARARSASIQARPSAIGVAGAAGALDDDGLHRAAAGVRRVCESVYLSKLSQPSETRSTAPTFGWVQSRSIIVSA